jgi:hypothetical protein
MESEAKQSRKFLSRRWRQAGVVNFLDRHGPSGLAMTVKIVRGSR